MKGTVVSLLLCLLAAPVLAGSVPAKSELSLSGEFVQVDNCPDGTDCNPWALRSSLLFPLGKTFLLGPDVAIGSVDEANRLGAAFDWNVFGQKSVTPFIGASAFWFQKNRDEGPQHNVLARAGVKINVGKSSAIRLAAEDVIDGVGKDTTDLIVTAGILARF